MRRVTGEGLRALDGGMVVEAEARRGRGVPSMSNGPESEPGGDRPAMKTCRYCFELIRLEAVKCRYCGSSQTESAAGDPEADKPKDDKRVVYIVDRDLIRFAKFSIAVLALITIVGALFYGFDVKQLRSEIEKDNKAIREENQTLSKELTRTLDDAGKISADVKALRAKSEEDNKAIAALREENKALSDKLKETLDDARQVQTEIKAQAEAARANARRSESALASILKSRQQAETTVREIVAMQDGSLTVVQQTTSTSAVAPGRAKLWPNGTTLHVRFLGGEAADHTKVAKWAKAWSEFANVTFVFDDAPNAEIRISFEKGQGSWSYIGRDIVDMVPDQKQATMNLGWLDEANVLHQFGHVLGLQHEHQNPYEPVPWDEKAVYDLFGGPPNFWDKPTIARNILEPYSKDAYPIPKPFDAKSIMLYSFPNDLTKGDFSLQAGTTLSASDKAFIAKLYRKS